MSFRNLLVALVAVCAFAQTPEYLPLQAGNQWIYRSSGPGEGLVVEVARTQTVGDRTYYELAGLPEGPVWLRATGNGDYVAYDPETRQERPWLAFSTAEGVRFPAGTHGCNPNATIVSKSFRGVYSLGEFGNLARIRYEPGPCADGGLESELWLPWVGLLQRTELTIAGPRTYELVYARINGVLMLTTPSTSFGITSDPPRYTPLGRPESLTVRLTLRHSFGLPLELTFPSGQSFDFVLRNEKGDEVYRWSATRGFPAVVQNLRVQGEKNWQAVLPLAAIAPGKYLLEGFLTTNPIVYRAQMAVEIRPGF